MELKSIKAKLILLLVGISAVPLIISIIISTLNTIADAEEAAEADGLLRNAIVQENISSLCQQNLTALRTLAAQPAVRHYLAGEQDERLAIALRQSVDDTNAIFQDGNNLIVTDARGRQVCRSDKLNLTEVSSRSYFQEGMQGKEYISEVLVSKSAGNFISVLEVPVKDDNGQPIGIVQRSYDLSVLGDFVKAQADDETRVLIIDAQGKLLAHSAKEVTKEEDRTDESQLGFVSQALAGQSGAAQAELEGEKCLICYSQSEVTGWVIATARPYSHIQAAAYRQAFTTAGLGMLLLVLAAFMAYALAGRAAAPIAAISHTAAEIAKGNLAQPNLTVTSGDELGQMSAAFNSMMDKLSAVLKRTSESALSVVSSSEELSATSEQSAQAANQISTSVTTVVERIKELKDAMEAAGFAIANMQQLLYVISDNSDNVAKASELTRTTADKGMETIEAAVSNMESLETSVNESAQVIQSLGTQSQEIGQIVDTISAIAEQTNLLALNAAIEAARAGKHGRGFAVVADEVRKLAEQSAAAADKISSLIRQVQTQTEKAVETMHAGRDITEKSAQSVSAAGGAFRAIAQHVNSLTEKVNQTNSAISEAHKGSDKIVEAVINIDAASSRLAMETETVSAATEEQGAAIEEVATASRQLAEMAGKLQQAVAEFKLR